MIPNAKGRRVEEVDMKCLRRALVVSVMDRVGNVKEKGRGSFEQEKQSRLKWIGCMERTDKGRFIGRIHKHTHTHTHTPTHTHPPPHLYIYIFIYIFFPCRPVGGGDKE